MLLDVTNDIYCAACGHKTYELSGETQQMWLGCMVGKELIVRRLK